MLLTRGTCPQVPYFCRSRIVSTRSRVRFIRSLRPRVDKNSECAVSLSPDHRQLFAFKDKRSVMTSPTIPANVLVVEDEMVLRMRAVDIVEDAGFTAVEAGKGGGGTFLFGMRLGTFLFFFCISKSRPPGGF